jgi:hemolysin activation/secretion protein
VCATLAAPLQAQVPAQQLPGTVQPGQTERELRPLPVPRVTPEGIQIPAPSQKAPAGAEGIKFRLRDVQFAGNTVYGAETLRAEARALLERDVSLADLYALADRITAKYRNEGYILSQTLVPPQEIQGGVVRLQVVEGFVNDVRLSGDIKGNRELVEAYAAAIRASRPLQARILERYLLLMNDLSGATARATVVPSATAVGAADLEIAFTHRTVTGAVSLDNRGGRFLGPWRYYGEADFNSLFGRYDKTALRGATSLDRTINYGSVLHEQPIGTEGGRIGVLLAYSHAEPKLDGALAASNLETNAFSGAITYSHPLLRSRSANLYARASLGFHNGETEIIGVPIAEDRIRMVRVGATYDYADPYKGINIVDVELSQGLDAFGARESGSDNLSRAGGRSDFTKVGLYAARLQSLAARWAMLAAINGQYAANPLLASEQFAFGGAQFGRGYDAAELVGDSGIAGKLELRYSDALASLPLNYVAYSFYDVGRVWRRNAVNEASSESGTSYGLGLRFDLTRRFSGFGELAKPATRNVRAEGDRDLRGYIGVAYKF